MRHFIIATVLTSLLFFKNGVFAQELNWRNLQEERHVLNINAGLMHGVVFGTGYGYRLNTTMPVILHAEYSFPSGKNLTDDLKSKIGGQARLFQIGNFHLSTKITGIFRKHENTLVRMLNFGSDLSVTAGYYRPRWFVAGDFGFDKAIVTHFRHTEAYRDIFPGVKDGWYEPATGGNFNYGLQAGFSFKSSDIYLKMGKVLVQDLKTKPFVPVYFQLGYTFRINRTQY
jgi:hypothetical protein